VLIEIWSDVVCPWCYIGKRRLEKALSSWVSTGSTSVGGSTAGRDVDIVYRSFQLDPAAPTEPSQTVAEHLGAKYGGGPEAGRQMVERTEAVAAEEGLPFRLAEAQRANTADAHRLLHLALAESPDVQARLKEALLSAYFLRAENVADHDVLLAAATSVGIDEVAVNEVLAGDAYADAVEHDIREAASLGATGVPFFVVDRKYAVSGAQPLEVFSSLLEQAWSDEHPRLQVLADGTVCGPDGCPIPTAG
jgi:predicted DsbA family dithiol-disulfide isomerase